MYEQKKIPPEALRMLETDILRLSSEELEKLLLTKVFERKRLNGYEVQELLSWAHKTLTNAAILSLLLAGMVEPIFSDDGMKLSILEEGKLLLQLLYPPDSTRSSSN